MFLRKLIDVKLIDVKLIDVLCHIFVQKSISEPDISRQPSHRYPGKETNQLLTEIVNTDMRNVLNACKICKIKKIIVWSLIINDFDSDLFWQISETVPSNIQVRLQVQSLSTCTCVPSFMIWTYCTFSKVCISHENWIELIFKIFDTYGIYIPPFWSIARFSFPGSLRSKIRHKGKQLVYKGEWVNACGYIVLL